MFEDLVMQTAGAIGIEPTTFVTWMLVAAFVIVVGIAVVVVVYKALDVFIVGAAVDDLREDFKTTLDLHRYADEQIFLMEREKKSLTV